MCFHFKRRFFIHFYLASGNLGYFYNPYLYANKLTHHVNSTT